MNVSINWLRELVELPPLKTQSQLDQLARQITEHCFEVEKVHAHVAPAPAKFSGVFTALVTSAEKHPNADRLRVVSLRVGDREVAPVVCGAWNFGTGDVVALALPGAAIPHNVHSDAHESFTLGKAKIRGVESQGMVCSGFELGLVPEPEATPEILVLPKGTPHGKDFAEYLAQNQNQDQNFGAVFEVSLPPNRPDLYSHLGIARELAAALALKPTERFRKLNAAAPKLPKPPKGNTVPLSVTVEDHDACRTYIGMRISVKVRPSPKSIQDKLLAVGLRPINNVVDITNLVMYEIGQPLHAFDASQVHGGIVVRQATARESITTIDHKVRKLEPGMLVIADAQAPLAIAGIMGGTASEVSGATTEIILESANFDPVSIHKTSRSLGLRTDGSGFWEKGLKPEQAVAGAALALEYLTEYAGAQVLDISVNGTLATPAKAVPFTAAQINALLGSSYSPSHVKKVLTAFGFTVSGSAGKSKAILPYFRQDVLSYADLAEEVLKVTGMNEMPKEPLLLARHAVAVNRDEPLERVKDYLCNLGFSEVQNYSFISEADIQSVGSDPAGFVKIKNPLSGDQGYLKQDLLVPMLKNVALNEKHSEAFRLFEVGKAYFGYGRERDLAAFVTVNKNSQPELLLAQAKGAVENLIGQYAAGKKVTYHVVTGTPDVTILAGDLPIGTIRVITPQLRQEFGIRYPAVYAQIEMKALGAVSDPLKYTHINRFPTIELDTSIVVAASISWKQIQDIVDRDSSGLVSDVNVFEAAYLYPPGKMPKFHAELATEGKKNIAFRMVFVAAGKTLSDSEISPIYAKILVRLQDELNAEIR
jgi:phenylalanyl-tRNA synthetase beta chain